jgi:6-phosphogluconolactonase
MICQTRTVLYAAIGSELTLYDVDLANATLTKQTSVTLPANVQEAWPGPSHKYLYVAWSNRGDANAPVNGNHHGITAFRVDPKSGALSLHGQPVTLPYRPIFITPDPDGTHLIAAYNEPSGLTVNRILPDGTLGDAVKQPADLNFGIYGHQVRSDPSGRTVVLVTRGNGPTATTPEDPGAIKVFGYKAGVLSNLQSIAPDGGFGYQVRHLAYHPSGKWAFVTLERQNQIHVYKRMPDGTLGTTPLFVKGTLMPTTHANGQTAASIHFLPNGKTVYVANRGGEGGENSVAVLSVNPQTGEPTLVQTIDTHGFEPRTFTLDQGGKVLAVANQTPHTVKGVSVPASVAMYKIGADGTLTYVRKYDMETSPGQSLFWAGMISLP